MSDNETHTAKEELNISKESDDSMKEAIEENILDVILNNKTEKFDDEEHSKRGDSAMDDLDDDDDESLEDHDINADLIGSDISSEGDEDPQDDISEADNHSGSDTEDKVKLEKKSPSPASDHSKEDVSEEADKKKKGKKYDYATKLNYLFRDARFFLVKSNNPENVSLAKVNISVEPWKICKYFVSRPSLCGQPLLKMKQSSIKHLQSLEMFFLCFRSRFVERFYILKCLRPD